MKYGRFLTIKIYVALSGDTSREKTIFNRVCYFLFFLLYIFLTLCLHPNQDSKISNPILIQTKNLKRKVLRRVIAILIIQNIQSFTQNNVLLARLRRKINQEPYLSPLNPLRFLLRSAIVFANKTAVVHRERCYTYRELSDRVRKLTTILIENYNIKPGDRVAVLCQNITPNLESMYAIPAAGAIMVPVNTRLAAKEVEYVVQHSGANVLFLQQEFDSKITDLVKSSIKIIHISDSDDPRDDPYELMLTGCTLPFAWAEMPLINDENAMFSINYTSGSTGRPKGVAVSYRGVYITALGMAINGALSVNTAFLWTLPMFHCNGN